jgi:hypothetical protein
VRRSRLLPGQGACSGRLGSITGPGMIDVNARHSEREVEVLIAHAAAQRERSRTARVSSAGELVARSAHALLVVQLVAYRVDNSQYIRKPV